MSEPKVPLTGRLTIAHLVPRKAKVHPPVPAPEPARPVISPPLPHPLVTPKPPPAARPKPTVKQPDHPAPAPSKKDQRKQEKAQRVYEMHQALGGRYPVAFATSRPPLAIGIFDQIIVAWPECDRLLLGIALRQWVGRALYQANLTTHARRVSLDGTPAGEITEGEREHAATRLAALNELSVKRFDESIRQHQEKLSAEAVQKRAQRKARAA